MIIKAIVKLPPVEAAVVIRTDKLAGTGKRSGLLSYRISVRRESKKRPRGGALLEGPFVIPEYEGVRARNQLCDRYAAAGTAVRTWGTL